jgi:UDP-N-acetyl-D-mannosaminuronate dehydrogenase
MRLGKSLDEMKNKTVCTVGLGYVGLPLAKAFVIENKSM